MCLRYCHRSIWGPSSTRVSSPSSTSFHVRSFLKETVFILLFNESHNVFLHFDIAKVKTRFTREPLVTTVSLLNLTKACVPEKHSAAFNLRSFLHESVFILLFIESNNVFLHFGIVLVKTRFTREPLVLTVSLVNLTVACAPEKHRAAFNLKSFLHESVFILLFIEGPDVFLHFDIAQVKTRFTQEPLVTTASSVTLTVTSLRNTVPRSI